MKVISILGCGWYGLALGKALALTEYTVKGSTTSSQRIGELELAGLHPYLVNITGDAAVYDEDFFNCDTLIISIPPKLRGGEHEEYLRKIEQLVTVIKQHGVKQVIYISSTGVYPEINAEIDENTPFKPDTPSAQTLLEAENLLIKEPGFSTTIIRFGGLVGPGRHPGRFFAGKTDIPNGQAPVNLIHLQDCIGITQSILHKNAFGYVFNACSPHHMAKQEFYMLAAQHADLPLPQFTDKLTNWKTINSTNVPAILNYRFMVDNWPDCFANNLF